MIFGDDPGQVPGWLMFVFGGAGGGAVGGLGAFLMKLLDRSKADAKDRKADEDADEEKAIVRLERVMKMREEDCDRRINELTQRVAELERDRGTRQAERDASVRREAMYDARVKYLTGLLRRAKIDPEDWDKPDTAPDGFPGIDPPPKRD